MTRVLVTGGAGFIGSHLCEHLLADGFEVTALDDLSTGRIDNIAHLESNPHFKVIIDDVQNEKLMETLVHNHDQVFHLAAAVGVRLVIEQPVACIINNIMGTEVVLKQATRFRRPVLITSTSEVYGKSNKDTFQEGDDSIMGSTQKSRWGYAASKAIDEFLALAYYSEKRLPVVIVRLFNTVGPRQTGRYGMVIPNFVRQALAGMPITVFGDGEQSRCFAHVLDVAPALVSLLNNPTTYGNVFNVGSQEEITIGDLARKVKSMTNSSSEVRMIPYSEAYPQGFEDMARRMPDTSKIKEFIGYQTRYNLDDILNGVIKEYQQKGVLADQPGSN